MGRVFMTDLKGSIYVCKHCKTHLSKAEDILSKNFTCNFGRIGYLFDNVVNVSTGAREEKMMITGLYTVVDIYCVGCGSNFGWKYEVAHDENQKYKEGKFVLELYQISGPHDSYDLIDDEDVLDVSSISLS